MRNRRQAVVRNLQAQIETLRSEDREALRAQRREDNRVQRLRRLSGSVRLTTTDCHGNELVSEFRLMAPPDGVCNWPGYTVVELGETVLYCSTQSGMGTRERYLAPHFALRMVQQMIQRGYVPSVIDGLVFPENI